MNRFRLGIVIVALLQPLLVGCCCGEKFQLFRRGCCPERTNCCPTSGVPILSGSGYVSSPMSTPSFGSGYSAAPMFDSSFAPSAPIGSPGCASCGVAGQPTSGNFGNGFPISAAPQPYSGSAPILSGPPPIHQGNPAPVFPGPINTIPHGTLPSPMTNEPPTGTIPQLQPVPLVPPTPGQAQPTPAEAASRSNLRK